jgi:hypothetical protein
MRRTTTSQRPPRSLLHRLEVFLDSFRATTDPAEIGNAII